MIDSSRCTAANCMVRRDFARRCHPVSVRDPERSRGALHVGKPVSSEVDHSLGRRLTADRAGHQPRGKIAGEHRARIPAGVSPERELPVDERQPRLLTRASSRVEHAVVEAQVSVDQTRRRPLASGRVDQLRISIDALDHPDREHAAVRDASAHRHERPVKSRQAPRYASAAQAAQTVDLRLPGQCGQMNHGQRVCEPARVPRRKAPDARMVALEALTVTHQLSDE